MAPRIATERIRVGVIGVGNCCAGLVQGIEYYRRHPGEEIVGLMHRRIGRYSIFDIDFVSAFDVGANKVGKPLWQAVYEEPNLVRWLTLLKTGNRAVVAEAPILDGVGIYVENKIKPLKHPTKPALLRTRILEHLARTNTEVLVNYLPVGSQQATEFWAGVALEAGCAFVNCIPVFIASHARWAREFEAKRIPVIGDDIKGQIGATIVHRLLAWLVGARGSKINRTYQLNVGGNTDFLNMKEIARLTSKKISKTKAVQSQIAHAMGADDIHIGPSDFIPFLGNTKLAYIRLEGRMFANIPFNLETRLEVDDKANSAGVVIDAIRIARLACDRGIGGALPAASAYFMKHPAKQMSDDEARRLLEAFIRGRG